VELEARRQEAALSLADYFADVCPRRRREPLHLRRPVVPERGRTARLIRRHGFITASVVPGVMALAPALRAAIRVLRGRPDDLLPAFLLTPAVSVVVRVVTFAGLGSAYAYLAVTGRLRAFRTALVERDLDPPDPNTEPEAFAEWLDAFVPLLETLATPTTVAILAVTAVVSLLCFLVLSAVVTAAQLAACRATLDDDRGTTAAIRGGRRHFPAVLGLFVLEFLLWLVLTGAAVVAVAAALSVSRVLGLPVGLIVGLLWVLAVAAIRFGFAFAPVVAVVDGVGTVAAVRGGYRFVRSRPVDAFGYALLAVALLGALSSLAALSPEAGGVLMGVGSFLLVAPALALSKTALYADHVDAIAPPAVPDRSITAQLGDGLRRGLGEMVRFARRSPVALGLSALLFVAGVGLGWVLAAPYEGVVTASIEGRLEGHFPPTAALFFAANNWTVAVASGLGGLALAVPSAVSLLFNGAMFGVYGRLEVAPLELVAFVAPHGVLELPALVVAGALGLSLGAAAWRTARGRETVSDLAAAVERAFWVLVGVGVVLAAAGLVEGFLSPYYYRPFLGAG
jgi:uncharacterized membrane protein SpoIIM required for sporulation